MKWSGASGHPFIRGGALLATASILAIVGLMVEQSAPGDWTGGPARPPEPASLAVLVENSDIVVIGSVASIYDTDRTSSNSPDLDRFPHIRAEDHGTAWTNLRIDVIEYVVGDGPSEVLVRHIGDATDRRLSWEQHGMPPRDRPVLFFLVAVDDHRPDLEELYTPVLGWWGEMVERGGTVEYADGRPITFLHRPVSLIQLMGEVRALAP